MRRLILLRHAKTESVSAGGGDFDRALTPRGWRDAALIGRVLAEAGFLPDLVLTSPAKRAAETWRALADDFPNAAMEEARALYLASAEQIARLVQKAGQDVDCLLVIGHNPGLHEFAAALAAGPPTPSAEHAALTRSLPTAAATVFDRDQDDRLRLTRFIKPKDHGGGSE